MLAVLSGTFMLVDLFVAIITFYVYFLPLSFQKFLVLILLTLEGWKTESTSEPPSGFEHGTPRLGIQHLNHWAISTLWVEFIWKSVRRFIQYFYFLDRHIKGGDILDFQKGGYHRPYQLWLYWQKGHILVNLGQFKIWNLPNPPSPQSYLE